MKRYITYFKYVILHKWYVFKSILKVNPYPTPYLLVRLILHDISKFRPSEFIPYAKTFYNEDGSKCYNETKEYNMAWNLHQKRNKHHWQYWLLKEDSGKVIPMDMPVVYIEEMLCDWLGAGRAINGVYDYDMKWYMSCKDNIIVSEQTKCIIESILLDIKEKNNI